MPISREQAQELTRLEEALRAGALQLLDVQSDMLLSDLVRARAGAGVTQCVSAIEQIERALECDDVSPSLLVSVRLALRL